MDILKSNIAKHAKRDALLSDTIAQSKNNELNLLVRFILDLFSTIKTKICLFLDYFGE